MPAVQMYSNFAEVAIAAYGVNLTATDDLLREYREKSGSRKIGVKSRGQVLQSNILFS